MEQDVVTLKAQLVEKQAVLAENDRLKLQLDSVHTQSQIEQKKAGEDRSDVRRRTARKSLTLDKHAGSQATSLPPSQKHLGPAEGCLHQAF